MHFPFPNILWRFDQLRTRFSIPYFSKNFQTFLFEKILPLTQILSKTYQNRWIRSNEYWMKPFRLDPDAAFQYLSRPHITCQDPIFDFANKLTIHFFYFWRYFFLRFTLKRFVKSCFLTQIPSPFVELLNFSGGRMIQYQEKLKFDSSIGEQVFIRIMSCSTRTLIVHLFFYSGFLYYGENENFSFPP